MSHDLDALDEVADEGLPLRQGPLLEEFAEVRDVFLDLLGGGKLYPPLFELAGSFFTRSR